MLLNFKVRNFRSFKDEQQLSFEATALRGISEPVSVAEVTSHGLLKVTAIYGANASGKTNVLKALAFVRDAVRDSQKQWDPEGPIDHEPFILDLVRSQSSRFEIDFVLQGVLYQYGFELNAEEILEEWLFAYPSKKKQIWFHRTASFQFGRALPGENQAIANLTRRNSLFLSAAAQNAHEALMPIYRWFSSIHFVTSSQKELHLSTARMCENPEFKKTLVKMLGAADLGVIDVDTKEEEIDDAVKQIMEKMKDIIPSFRVREKTTKVSLRHRVSSIPEGIPLPLKSESEGTIAYFSLLGPVIRTILDGGVLCMDELDASLHPLLARQIVGLFGSERGNPHNAQLLFNTHNTNLLSKELLRRDQIWFTEKDKDGASHLYRLTEHKPRRNEDLEAGYLQGRYGAIPVLGSLDVFAE